MATTTRRTFVGAAALGAIGATVAIPHLVLGKQDTATPATGDDAAAPSLLSGLGLPEFTVNVTNEGLEFEPETTAGTVLLKVSNQSDGWAGIQFLQVDPSITEEDILAGLGPDVGIPEFAHESVMTGGVSCEPGASGEVAFVLGPGDWWVLNTGEAFGVFPLVVTGEVAEVAIEADVEVEMAHHDFTMPSEIGAGPKIWHLVNVDPVLHHLLILSFPRAVTEDEVLAGIMAQEGMGTPPADLDLSQIAFMGESGLISEGQSNWLQWDLPGWQLRRGVLHQRSGRGTAAACRDRHDRGVHRRLMMLAREDGDGPLPVAASIFSYRIGRTAMDKANQEPGGASMDDGPRDVHRYDSFVVRLWSRGDGARFGRAELRHVQSDVVSTGTMVGLEWVDAEMERLMGLHEKP